MGTITSPDLVLSVAESQASNRWYYEHSKLSLFPSFSFKSTGGKIVAAEGVLDTPQNNSYGIRIDLSRHPFEKPWIFPNGWPPHPDCPHRFNNGSLCVMRSDQWIREFSVALVIAKTAIWLAK